MSKNVLLLSATLAVCASLPSLAAAAPPTVVVGETIDVRAVNVEAVVTDRSGQVVHGLSAADFELRVDGQPVPVDYFTEVRDGQAAAPAADHPSTANAPAPQVSPGAAVGRSYLVFVDDGFAIAAPRDAALRRLRDGLSQLRRGDQMAVIEFDGFKITALCGWSGDRSALAAALDRAAARRPSGNRLLAQSRSLRSDADVERLIAEPGIQAQALSMLAGRVSPEAVSQLDHSAQAAAAALRAFELPAGRRIMLLLSAGWSLSAAPQAYLPLLDTADQLGYTIYPVDVATAKTDEVILFDRMAEITGGRAFGSGAAVLGDIAHETSSYYWLGFTSNWKAEDRRHAIEVRVHREGLAVRTRRSVADLSARTTAAMKAESVLYFGAEGERPGAPGPRLEIAAGKPRASGRDEMEIMITLGVPVAALSFSPQGSGFVGEGSLAVAALDRQGGRVELPGTAMSFRFASLPLAAGLARFPTTLKLRRIDQHLVFAVPDARSGAVLTADLEVHPP